MKLIKDPVHGYITISPEEQKVIDTYAFQRLRRINQLPLVYLVYPGARHSRFDHSLGSLFIAGEFASHLGLDEHETELLRVSSLLHDLGHTPYSHLLEVFLLDKDMSHEDLSVEILKSDAELAEAVEATGVSTKEVIDVLEGRSELSSLVSGPLDVDRLDFLVRDAYFTGATYGVIDVRRIIHLTRLTDEGPSIDVKGLGAVEEMALARHHSFMNIYFHHSVRAAQVLFLRGAETLREEGVDFASMSVEEYLSHDDLTVWCMMRNNPKTKWVIERIERRVLPKRVFERKLSVERPIASTTSERSKLEEEISELAGVDREKIYIDSSHAPPLTRYGPAGIRLHSDDGRPVEVESWILEMVSKPIEVVRVYVDREVKDLERVREAAARLFS